MRLFSSCVSREYSAYAARLPVPKTLDAMGAKHVLYVAPSEVQELDDLNAVFVDWQRSGHAVKATASTDFRADPSTGRVCYGGSEATHEGFWVNHTWGRAAAGGATTPVGVSTGHLYEPRPRPTMFGALASTPDSYVRMRPDHFGMAPVVVAA